MATNFDFRNKACGSLTSEIGVYVLCDLDKTPIYVGQSKDGIRSRVRRHLTSARSDIIANRQIDVWEIAYVMAYPVADRAEITPLEDRLYHIFNNASPLMNGTVPARIDGITQLPEPAQIVQVMSDAEIEDKSDPVQRLPRQAAHYTQMVDHFLNVKKSTEILRAMEAHFDRLQRYHNSLVKLQEN
jgi:2-polyprenyl-6-methoxyphenol hydroxylase-like FAD-dependent oxidoreductase